MPYKFANKIEAIKAIRSITGTIVEDVNQNGIKCFRLSQDIGLLEAKQMTEAIMELGAAEKQAVVVSNAVVLQKMRDEIADLRIHTEKVTNAYNTLRNKVCNALDLASEEFYGKSY